MKHLMHLTVAFNATWYDYRFEDFINKQLEDKFFSHYVMSDFFLCCFSFTNIFLKSISLSAIMDLLKKL